MPEVEQLREKPKFATRVRDKPRVRLSEVLQTHVSDLAAKEGVNKNTMLEILVHLGIASHLLMDASISEQQETSAPTSN